VTPRIIALDPSFALNPYITAMGLEDIDRFPEIKRALDSPPPVPDPQFERFGEDVLRRGSGMSGTGGATGLRYTQTIMGGRSGGAGMRVSGRRADAGDAARRLRLRSTERRANSSSHDMRPPVPRGALDRAPAEDTFLTAPRPRSDSAPMAATAPARDSLGIAMGMGMPPDVPEGLSVSVSDASAADTGEDETDGLKVPSFGAGPDTLGYGSSIGGVLPSDPSDAIEDPLAGEAVDEGSDVDEDEVVDEDEAPVLPMPPMLGRRPSQALRDAVHYGAGPGAGGAHHGPGNRVSVIHEEERRSSTDTNAEVKLEFHKVVPVRPIAAPMSALTEALKPRLDAGTDTPDTAAGGFNPYGALYALVAAPPSAPSLDLELFFPHSEQPSVPLQVTVRKDATVEEVTGHGLFRYWEEGREPRLEDQSGTVNWGLRIVEDDGEVDEDFPALDRESQISKFSYGQFGIVEATETQSRCPTTILDLHLANDTEKQNAAMAPLIQRRPSRVDLSRGPALARPQANAAAATTATTNINNSSANPPATADEILTPKSGGGRAPPVLLRVRVSAGADVNFTTTISV
jgi:hypothetical protein